MKVFKLLMAIAVVGFFSTSCSNDQIDFSAEELAVEESVDEASFARGSVVPSGAHYNLNIIGMQKDKTADMTGNNGRRIFVKLWGKSKIKLIEGPEFAVLDANGTDNDGASFQLPNPDPDGDGITAYSIWMRPLGKPGGSAIISLCADADLTDDYQEVCTADPLEVERSKGPSRFKDVTKKLLTILVVDDIVFIDGDGVEQTIKAGRYGIFDDTFEDYFWEYDNSGLKLLQLRFYPIPSEDNILN